MMMSRFFFFFSLFSSSFLTRSVHADCTNDTTSLRPQGKIDTHLHLVLPEFIRAVQKAGDDPAGTLVTRWSPAEALAYLDTLNVSRGILSFTSPGPLVGGRALVREMNVQTKAIADGSCGRFGWYASLPGWEDGGRDATKAVGEEARWALEEANADGLVIMSSYGERLLGDPAFAGIWDKLDDLGALIFLHPSEFDVTPRFIGTHVPQPLIDYPLATTRTAADLVVSQTLASHPNVKIILSHAGGTLPFLADRISTLAPLFNLSSEATKRDLKRFYFDLALATSTPQLRAILAFADPTHLLYGSDWPYVTEQNVINAVHALEAYVAKDKDGEGRLLDGMWRDNAIKLFGWKA